MLADIICEHCVFNCSAKIGKFAVARMYDVFSIALVSPYSGNRFSTYLKFYAEFLLKRGKKVVVLSPEYLEINEFIQTRLSRYAINFSSLSLDENLFSHNKPRYFELLKRWSNIAQKIKLAEKQQDARVDFVFFCPVDPFIRESVHLRLLNWTFPYKWSGIYLNPAPYRLKQLKLNTDPRFLEPDYLFRSSNCVGVCVMDRFITEPLKSRVYKKVVVFPELTNVNIQRKESAFAAEIRQMSKGRMVVGLLGVEKSEGISALIRLIKRVDTDKFFFVFAGRLDMEQMDEEQRLEVDAFMEEHADNVFFILQQLSDDEVNLLYREIDISYLYFYNYVSSNHLLTKAAYFKKPVLANKDFCVGETVKKFRLGLSVNGKMEESVDALEFIRLDRLDFNIFDKSAFDEYYALQSERFLQDAFEQILLF